MQKIIIYNSGIGTEFTNFTKRNIYSRDGRAVNSVLVPELVVEMTDKTR